MIDTIHNENCLDTMGRMPNDYIDLTVTSPPYDNLRNYNGYSFDFPAISKELYRVTKQGGLVVWVVNDATINGDESCSSFKQILAFRELGFKLHDTMIWLKPNWMPIKAPRYQSAFEYMFVLSKGKPNTANLIQTNCVSAGQSREGNKYYHGANTDVRTETPQYNKPTNETRPLTNVWTIAPNAENCKVHGHPAQFPVKLARDHIISWSNEGGLVYDPFMGAGTTAVAAIKAGRHYIGSEISEKYCLIAQDRIAKCKH